MSSIDIKSVRSDFPGMPDGEAAKALAEKYNYIAVVRYKRSPDGAEFTNFGTCTTEAEMRGYLTSPYCHDAEVIYDARSALFPLNAEHVLQGHCEMCGKRTTPETLQMGAGNDFYFCRKCGLLFCEGCYVRLPLTGSPGYGLCPTCRIQVKRAIPSFFVTGSDRPREAEKPTALKVEDLTAPHPEAGTGPLSPRTANWYQAEDARKSVRQIVIEIPPGSEQASKFGQFLFGMKYMQLMSNTWTAGFFRLDGDPGPYLLVRGDKVASRLKGYPMRVAFSFYRMRAGGLCAIFVDVDCPEVRAKLTYPHVLFETMYGLDMADTKTHVQDAISRDSLHLCFAEGDGPGEMHVGYFSSKGIKAQFDVVAPLGEDCRAALKGEWEGILNYHASIPASHRDFQQSGSQMAAENPQTENPILARGAKGGTAPAGLKEAPKPATPVAVGVQPVPRPAASVAPATAPTDSFLSRALGVFISPGRTFESIARRPDFIAPLVVSILAAIAVTEAMLAKIGMERIIRQSLEMSGKASQMSADQIALAVQRGTAIGSIRPCGGTGWDAGLPVDCCRSGILITNAVFGATTKFKVSFSVVCYSYLVV